MSTQQKANGALSVVQPSEVSPMGSSMSLSLNPQQLLMMAIEKGASLEFLERLLDIRGRLMQEEAEKQFYEAMSEFQKECPVIVKDKIVKDKQGKERYRYADLGSIVRQVGPLIAKNGFSYTVKTVQDGNKVTSGVKASHSGGHSEISEFGVPIDKDAYMTEPQKASSAATFSKRVAFCNAFGILTGDDDDDNDIDHPGKRTESEPEFFAPDPAEVLRCLREEIVVLSRQVFSSKEERDGWTKDGGYDSTSIGGCQKIVHDLSVLAASKASPVPGPERINEPVETFVDSAPKNPYTGETYESDPDLDF